MARNQVRLDAEGRYPGRALHQIPVVRGLILETFGAGNAPEDEELIDVLREGISRGIVIVSVTQCM